MAIGAQRRAVGLAISVVAGAAAVVLAVVPFHVSVDDVSVPCRASAISAWHRGPKEPIGLWAVTVGTSETGYEYRFGGEAWCAEHARPRLLVAAALAVAAAAGARSTRRAGAA